MLSSCDRCASNTEAFPSVLCIIIISINSKWLLLTHPWLNFGPLIVHSISHFSLKQLRLVVLFPVGPVVPQGSQPTNGSNLLHSLGGVSLRAFKCNLPALERTTKKCKTWEVTCHWLRLCLQHLVPELPSTIHTLDQVSTVLRSGYADQAMLTLVSLGAHHHHIPHQGSPRGLQQMIVMVLQSLGRIDSTRSLIRNISLKMSKTYLIWSINRRQGPKPNWISTCCWWNFFAVCSIRLSCSLFSISLTAFCLFCSIRSLERIKDVMIYQSFTVYSPTCCSFWWSQLP